MCDTCLLVVTLHIFLTLFLYVENAIYCYIKKQIDRMSQIKLRLCLMSIIQTLHVICFNYSLRRYHRSLLIPTYSFDCFNFDLIVCKCNSSSLILLSLFSFTAVSPGLKQTKIIRVITYRIANKFFRKTDRTQ